MVATSLIVGLGIVTAIFVNAFVLAPATIDRPTAPSSVAAIRNQWDYTILLPTVIPKCLAYDAAGTSVIAYPIGSSEHALRITLTPVSSESCAGASGSTVRITEAPALESLGGMVTTVSPGRMQFARVAQPAPGGQIDVTLQWHCANIMCRLTGTTNHVITEAVLTQMADSFQIIKPSS